MERDKIETIRRILTGLVSDAEWFDDRLSSADGFREMLDEVKNDKETPIHCIATNKDGEVELQMDFDRGAYSIGIMNGDDWMFGNFNFDADGNIAPVLDDGVQNSDVSFDDLVSVWKRESMKDCATPTA